MQEIFIFGAKYLWVASVIIAIALVCKSEKRREILAHAALALPLAYLLGVLARALYYNPRPFVVGAFEPLVAHAADNGFPSDHVLLVASIAAVTTAYNRKFGALLWAIAAFVAISRVYVGVHHSLDVAASAVISILAAWVVYLFLKWRTNKPSLSPSQ